MTFTECRTPAPGQWAIDSPSKSLELYWSVIDKCEHYWRRVARASGFMGAAPDMRRSELASNMMGATVDALSEVSNHYTTPNQLPEAEFNKHACHLLGFVGLTLLMKEEQYALSDTPVEIPGDTNNQPPSNYLIEMRPTSGYRLHIEASEPPAEHFEQWSMSDNLSVPLFLRTTYPANIGEDLRQQVIAQQGEVNPHLVTTEPYLMSYVYLQDRIG